MFSFPSGISALISLAVTMLAGLGYLAQESGPTALNAFLSANPETAGLFLQTGTTQSLHLCFVVFGDLGLVCGVCGVLSLLR